MFRKHIFKLCLFVSATALAPFCQEIPTTAEQVIAKYLDAMGGSEKLAAIVSSSEKGVINSNIAGRTLGPTRWRFESYYKAPNLRALTTFNENGVGQMQGCTGKIAWYRSASGESEEYEPKPGAEYTCHAGVDLLPLLSGLQGLKVELKGKKKIDGRAAWEVKVTHSENSSATTYYFDAENYLLLRSRTLFSQSRYSALSDESYSDYREVGGIKFPFKRITQGERSKTTTTIEEVRINIPIDDAIFVEPDAHKGKTAKAASAGVSPAPAASSIPAANEPVAPIAAPSATGAPAASQITYVNAVKYVSSPIDEVRRAVPELKGLKPDENQSGLKDLLDKIGAATVEIAGKTPNLMADEEVDQVRLEQKKILGKFSYLMVAHRRADSTIFDEFRVDLKTGSRIETDKYGNSSTLQELLRSGQLSAQNEAGAPLSQGYAGMWIRFYPSNRAESTFRYLGEQRIDGRRAFVVAFAQIPGAVRMPGQIIIKEKSLPVFYQGIAWVDAADFRILRLRSDLLEPLFDVSLTQLTAETEFAMTSASGFATPLWLPRQVRVNSEWYGRSQEETHRYSKWRSFQVHSRMVLE